MKKILFISFVLLISVSSLSQTLIKVGMSGMLNINSFQVVPTLGPEFSYEFGISPKGSLNLICNAHFGGIKTHFDSKLWQKDFLVGFQSEYKFFFKNRFEGKYISGGITINHLTSKYFFEPTDNDPVPTLVSWETHFGISYGTFINKKSKKYIFNPFIYIGYNPFDWNEYEARIRAGIMIGTKP